jgi:hypothetical protein
MSTAVMPRGVLSYSLIAPQAGHDNTLKSPLELVK